MIYRIASYLCEVLCREKFVLDEEKEIYEYGFQITMANFINLVIFLVIGTLSHSLLEMLLFYMMFVSLRFYCGGYHASSYTKCFLLFGMTCILTLVIKNMVMGYGNIVILLIASSLLQGICIDKMAPIEHKNRPFTQGEKKLFRKKSWIIYCFWLSVGMVLMVLRQWEFASVLLATFLVVSIFMLIEKIGGGKNDKEKKNS